MLQKLSSLQIAANEVCDWLIQSGELKPGELTRAKKINLPLGVNDPELLNTLLRLGSVTEESMVEAYVNLLGASRLSTEQPLNAQATYTERFCRHFGLVKLDENDSVLMVASRVPVIEAGLNALTYVAGKPISLVIATPREIEALIERTYGEGRSSMGALVETLEETASSLDDIEHLKDLASEAPVIRLVNLILQKAVECRASDIHVEPFETELKIRYRIDGQLMEGEGPSAGYAPAVISRLKIMARLDIAERRLPQDGRIMLKVQGRELDLRVSTVPTSFGESVVMRLLDRETVRFDFSSLGIAGEVLRGIEQLIAKPHGMFLVTGPTGSGKTTTLYTALSGLNTAERKIITVEDPVEYLLSGINQIQVKPDIGLNFSTALRSIVRQDPDVIMIGEMRDLETCRIAIQSSLTGHLVLSTLHTNSAAASITRLLDMGVEGYLIASALQGVLAQRLVRKLDPATRIMFEAPVELIERHHLDRYTDQRPIRLYRPDISEAGGGYSGRSAITELLILDDQLREALMRQPDSVELERLARQRGFTSLYEDGLRQVVAGITSLEEVLRVTGEDQR